MYEIYIGVTWIVYLTIAGSDIYGRLGLWYHVVSRWCNPTIFSILDPASYLKQMVSDISEMVTRETDLLQLA